MFVRLRRSVQGGKTYEYLQICESYREGAKVKQRLIANLGRIEHLRASGQLDGVLTSLAKFSDRVRVIEAHRTQGMVARSAKS